jgi:hypothetical protein
LYFALPNLNLEKKLLPYLNLNFIDDVVLQGCHWAVPKL